MTDGLLSLSWNNHKATFCHILSTLREKERYTDVTLACEGKFYPTHKLVLSTCSEYFEKMFENTSCKHPVILLGKDVKCDELEALLSYMYDGVVSVAQNDLARLIKAAELLQIKGLAVPDEPPQPKKNYTWTAREDRSPHAKRRRRDESTGNAPSDRVSSPLQKPDVENTGNSTDNDVSQRLEFTPKQEGSTVQSEGNTEETLVKEEMVETIDNTPNEDPAIEYSSHTGSNSAPGVDDPKFIQSQPLHEAVVEALAGPSGMQGWLGTGDMAGGFPLLETYSDEGNQDTLPVPVSGAQPAHPMVIPVSKNFATSGGTGGAKRNHCPYCSHTTVRKDHMSKHIRTHTGEKPYLCTHCPHRSSTRYALNKHIRIHTGEKPYSCTFCPYKASQKSALQCHLQRHKV